MGWWQDLGRESRIFVVAVLCALLLIAAATVSLAVKVAALSPPSATLIPTVNSQATGANLRGLIGTEVAALLTADRPSPTPTLVAATPTPEPDHKATQEVLRAQVRAEVAAVMTEMATNASVASPTAPSAETLTPFPTAPAAATLAPTATALAIATPTPTQAGSATVTPVPQATAAITEKQGPLPDLGSFWISYRYFSPEPEGWDTYIEVTVVNVGRATAEGFWVGAYVDQVGAEAEPLAAVYWFVPSLVAGGRLTLTSEEASGGEAKLVLPDGRYLISAEANIARRGQAPIAEGSSANNSLGPFALIIGEGP
ncbi:MAG: hypothetical protein ACUVWR_13500 [Anaerolineae bacterium]